MIQRPTEEQQINTTVKQTAKLLSTTTPTKWVTRDQPKKEAIRMIESTPNGTFNEEQLTKLKSYMDTLTTKGKEEIANIWTTMHTKELQNTQERSTFQKELQKTLNPTEVIRLKDNRFEIIDISKLNQKGLNTFLQTLNPEELIAATKALNPTQINSLDTETAIKLWRNPAIKSQLEMNKIKNMKNIINRINAQLKR